VNEADGESVLADELVARFIFQRNHLRADLSVKPNAFVPPSHRLELSVTRHLQLGEEGLWTIGRNLAQQRLTILRGRADAKAAVFHGQGLKVLAAPVVGNPNHANIVGWPPEKYAQLSIAQQLAASAGKARIPPA
jgi:hypothetical protein